MTIVTKPTSKGVAIILTMPRSYRRPRNRLVGLAQALYYLRTPTRSPHLSSTPTLRHPLVITAPPLEPFHISYDRSAIPTISFDVSHTRNGRLSSSLFQTCALPVQAFLYVSYKMMCARPWIFWSLLQLVALQAVCLDGIVIHLLALTAVPFFSTRSLHPFSSKQLILLYISSSQD